MRSEQGLHCVASARPLSCQVCTLRQPARSAPTSSSACARLGDTVHSTSYSWDFRSCPLGAYLLHRSMHERLGHHTLAPWLVGLLIHPHWAACTSGVFENLGAGCPDSAGLARGRQGIPAPRSQHKRSKNHFGGLTLMHASRRPSSTQGARPEHHLCLPSYTPGSPIGALPSKPTSTAVVWTQPRLRLWCQGPPAAERPVSVLVPYREPAPVRPRPLNLLRSLGLAAGVTADVRRDMPYWRSWRRGMEGSCNDMMAPGGTGLN